MSKNQEYTFFFDETSKYNVITIEEGTVNAINDRDTDCFIGVFLGFKNNDITSFEQKYTEFERDYLKKYKTDELKTTIFQPKYKYGFATVPRDQRKFYSDFLDCIIEMKPILHAGCFSHLEFMLRMAFFETHEFLNPDDCGVFFEALTKFTWNYATPEFYEKLSNSTNQRGSDQFKRYLLFILKKCQNDIKSIPRLKRLEDIIPFLMDVVKNTRHIIGGSRYEFTYRPSFDGLENLLNEIKIDKNDVNLIIDGEEDLYPDAEKVFPQVEYADSKKTPLIRAADLFAGLMRHIMIGINNNLQKNESTLESMNTDPYEKKNSIHTLDPEWFSKYRIVFDLYRKMNDIFDENRYYWSVMTLSQSHEFQAFKSLLEYFATFRTFEEYLSIKPEQHALDYMKHTVLRMSACDPMHYYT